MYPLHDLCAVDAGPFHRGRLTSNICFDCRPSACCSFMAGAAPIIMDPQPAIPSKRLVAAWSCRQRPLIIELFPLGLREVSRVHCSRHVSPSSSPPSSFHYLWVALKVACSLSCHKFAYFSKVLAEACACSSSTTNHQSAEGYFSRSCAPSIW